MILRKMPLGRLDHGRVPSSSKYYCTVQLTMGCERGAQIKCKSEMIKS